jgi:hypothetical protein
MKIIKNLINSNSNINLKILLVLTLGVILRLLMPLRGYNVDAESWRIVADIVNAVSNTAEEFLNLSAVEVTTIAAETAASPDCVVPCIT